MPSSPPQILPEFPLPAAVKASTLVGAGSTGVLFTAATAGAAGNELEIKSTLNSGNNDPQFADTYSTDNGTTVEIETGSKARMEITDDVPMTDGTNPVSFAEMAFVALSGGKALYTNSDGDSLAWDGAKWILARNDGITDPEWWSNDAVEFPDMATTWTAQGTATGSPDIFALVSSADQVNDAVNAASSLVDATLDGDGSGVFPALSSPQALTGGYSVAASPPAIQAAGGTVTPSSPPVIQS